MRTVEAQLRRVLDAAVRPAPVRVPISEAQGLLCAEEVVADRALPGFDQAAVDGFAVRAVDVREADVEPVELPVVGEVAAGSRQAHRLSPQQAVRVATGAPLPTLADAVAPHDHTDDAVPSSRARVTVKTPVPSAAFVRRTGEDVAPGDVAVRRGVVVGPAQVGLLAAVGRTKVLVHPKPRVSVIAVGDELVDVDRTPGAGQIVDVNSYALSAAARDAGAEVTRIGIVGSDPALVREAVEARLGLAEVVLVAGAVGGEHGEAVATALAELGPVDTSRVAMHPGSVQSFARLGNDEIPTFLLPANPTSALIVFEVLVRPLVRLALGRPELHRREVTARLLSPVASRPGRRSYVRGQLLRDRTTGDYLAQPLGTAGSHLLSSLAEANALIVIDEDTTEAGLDQPVKVAFLAPR
ncbi:gephyrin-like molybdotransferase Glp [Actinomycetospora sp. TBRC 11914]|uniref:molybdotransferase-like divisome protein Glp n=1 Tax=Actinomycetospora sp. TBRC 11914 TaxID=2729387 RepID=UPI00289EA5D3|nr:gephyrin-like molybdotransferase Glp [Actinomycetospora sp. TBRC 11914]